MSLLRLCVSVVLLFVAVTGCGSSTSPTEGTGAQLDESASDASTVEDDSQPTKESVDPQAESETAQSKDTTASESATLKQAMIDVAADLMQQQQLNAEPDAVRAQVGNAIAEARKDVADFLMVSAETEVKLRAGSPVEGAPRRIADAEAFLNEYGLQLGY